MATTEDIPTPTPRRADASPDTRRPAAPPKKDRVTILQELAPKAAFALNVIAVLAVIFMWNKFGWLPGAISGLIAALFILDDYVDSSKGEGGKHKWNFWGLMVEKFSNVGFLVLAGALCLVLLAREQEKTAEATVAAETAAKEKDATVAQLTETSKKVPTPDQVVVEKGVLEKMQARLSAIDKGTAGTPVTSGSDLKLTPAILSQIKRPDAKTIVLPKMGAGVNFALTAKKGTAGGLLTPPGGGDITIVENAMEVTVTNKADFDNAMFLYLTDGKRAGNSEQLPPVK